MAEDNKNWWQTLPGILTAVAGIITAVTGFLLAMNQSGCFRKEAKTDSVVQKSIDSSINKSSSETTGSANSNTSMPPASTREAGMVKDTPVTPVTTKTDDINLLSPDNGGIIITAGSNKWKETIDGLEDWVQLDYGVGQQAVYGFKDGKTATLNSFAMLITGTAEENIKTFELLAGNDSPTGKFTSLGKFTTQNMKIEATPYQMFTFQPVTAKYLKFKLISTWGWVHPAAYEFQLWGKPNG